MPVELNLFTGLKRKKAKRDTPRKKRETMSSTVLSRMYSEEAMQEFQVNMMGTYMCLAAVAILMRRPDYRTPSMKRIVSFLLLAAYFLATVATEMIVLDSKLLDASPGEEAEAGFYIELQDITLDSFAGDDECAAKTRFTREQIRQMIDKLEVGNIVRVYYNGNKYYKYRAEVLVIYMLRKMATARTHVDLCDSEFGGCPKRWGTDYNYIVQKFDSRFSSLIGPIEACGLGLPCFPISLKLFDSIFADQKPEREEMVSLNGSV